MDPWSVVALVAAVVPLCPPVNLVGCMLGGWRWRVAARAGQTWSRRISIAAAALGLAVAFLNVSLASWLESSLLKSITPAASAAIDIATNTDPIAAALSEEVGAPRRVTEQSSELVGGSVMQVKFSSRWRVDGPSGSRVLECTGVFVPQYGSILPVARASVVRLQRGDGSIVSWEQH